jgi:hypothetical protein
MTKSKFRAFALSFLASPVLMVVTADVATATDIPASAEFCSALVGIESTLSSSIPLVFLPPAVAKEVAGYQLSVVEPLFASAQSIAPQGISDAVATYASATIQSLSTLDFSATQTIEFATADDAIDAALLSDCGFEPMPVTATNYEYLNIKEEMPAGETALTLSNDADQVHEISIARIKDDIDMTARDILMLGEEDALDAIDLVAYAAAPPGGSETAFLNLAPGRYYAVCFTPTGTTSFHEAGDGPPHFLHGMLKEFVVR